jgi:hypothetical protein
VTDRRAFAVIVAAVAMAYANALAGTFHFDDYAVIVDQPAVHSWSAWLASMPGIRPLLKASYALSWSIAPSASAFILFNAACHAASACLVFVLARRWATQFGQVPRQPAHLALFAALIFVLHPAQTEAVTYVAGRSVSLMVLCYLGALAAHERGRTRYSLALFAAAMLVREAAWTLPFALVLIEAARGNRGRAAWRAARWHFALLAAGAGAALALPAYRTLLARSFGVRGPLTNLAAQVDGIGYLVSHPLLTLRLSIDPDIATGAFGVPWLAAAAALLLVAVLGVRMLHRRPLAGFAILWFLLQLLPTNSLIARLDLANDRQLYLALIGPALLVATALSAIRSPRVAALAATALVVVLGASTILRNRDYGSEVALWEATARASAGKARVWNNLGYARQLAGDRDGAAAAYRRALALDPAEYKARVNLELLERR